MYTLEYSVKQDAFHIDKVVNTLNINIANAINKRENDYRIIFIHKDYKILSDAIDFIKHKRDIKYIDGFLKELNISQSESFDIF